MWQDTTQNVENINFRMLMNNTVGFDGWDFHKGTLSQSTKEDEGANNQHI